jgi:small-conductance mechanosensitive channel
VEIEGVVGEVTEIGLLRTVLLETGNWNDSLASHRRKVAFVNSLAIEGHFFNFSTSGLWLWDELQILVPSAQNPYPIHDAIQRLVTVGTVELQVSTLAVKHQGEDSSGSGLL